MAYSSTEITKQNIQDAFWRLYTAGGITQVSVTKICQLAGYNRSTFYAHFQDIYEVLDSIESHIISPDSFKENILLPLLNTSDTALLLQTLINFFELHSPYLPALLGEHGDLQFRHKLLNKLRPILYENLPHTSYSHAQLDYIFEYQNAAIIAVITRWYQRGKDIPQQELIDILLHLTRFGLQQTLLL